MLLKHQIVRHCKRALKWADWRKKWRRVICDPGYYLSPAFAFDLPYLFVIAIIFTTGSANSRTEWSRPGDAEGSVENVTKDAAPRLALCAGISKVTGGSLMIRQRPGCFPTPPFGFLHFQLGYAELFRFRGAHNEFIVQPEKLKRRLPVFLFEPCALFTVRIWHIGKNRP